MSLGVDHGSFHEQGSIRVHVLQDARVGGEEEREKGPHSRPLGIREAWVRPVRVYQLGFGVRGFITVKVQIKCFAETNVVYYY